jgi:hypothetical protein
MGFAEALDGIEPPFDGLQSPAYIHSTTAPYETPY